LAKECFAASELDRKNFRMKVSKLEVAKAGKN